MDMMGFIPEDGVSPVSAFSGGWRMRIGLGKILLQDPNILLLDEPTNHLCTSAARCSIYTSTAAVDIINVDNSLAGDVTITHALAAVYLTDLESVEWLENFLQNQNLPMVIVSHDREFLDRVCTKIVDTDGGVATSYDGNYSRFLKLKKARLEAMEAAYATQQKKLADERAWINKFKNKGSFGSQQASSCAALLAAHHIMLYEAKH
eukprot:13324-Heterococcus_DN1.PRE.5